MKKITKLIKEEIVSDIKNADLSKADDDDGKESQDAKTYLAIQRCVGDDEPLDEVQIARYKDEATRRKLYNLRELYGCTADDYCSTTKKFHIDKIRSMSNHAQPEIVIRQNNSLQCMLTYEMVILKLWPEVKDQPFSLELLESRELNINDIERIRENSQEDIEKLSRVLGIRGGRVIKNIKANTCTRKKIINFINVVLGTTFELEIRSSGRNMRDRVDYKIIHQHPNNILLNDINFDLIAL
jgi:hypothetical protein